MLSWFVTIFFAGRPRNLAAREFGKQFDHKFRTKG